MKPCYGCNRRKDACAGTCEEYHSWMNSLKTDPEAMRRQRSVDGHVLHRDIWRQTL